jgi:hypothetical protein
MAWTYCDARNKGEDSNIEESYLDLYLEKNHKQGFCIAVLSVDADVIKPPLFLTVNETEAYHADDKNWEMEHGAYMFARDHLKYFLLKIAEETGAWGFLTEPKTSQQWVNVERLQKENELNDP